MKKVFFLIILTLILGCSDKGKDVAGNSSETTNDIAGTITFNDGSPGADVSLFLYKQPEGTFVASTTSDSLGNYVFEGIVTGDYSIEGFAQNGETLFLVDSIMPGDKEIHEVDIVIDEPGPIKDTTTIDTTDNGGAGQPMGSLQVYNNLSEYPNNELFFTIKSLNIRQRFNPYMTGPDSLLDTYYYADSVALGESNLIEGVAAGTYALELEVLGLDSQYYTLQTDTIIVLQNNELEHTFRTKDFYRGTIMVDDFQRTTPSLQSDYGVLWGTFPKDQWMYSVTPPTDSTYTSHWSLSKGQAGAWNLDFGIEGYESTIGIGFSFFENNSYKAIDLTRLDQIRITIRSTDRLSYKACVYSAFYTNTYGVKKNKVCTVENFADYPGATSVMLGSEGWTLVKEDFSSVAQDTDILKYATQIVFEFKETDQVDDQLILMDDISIYQR